MKHYVPDFEMDEDYSIPSTSSLTKQSEEEDEIVELLWQNNAPVTVNQRLFPKSPSSSSNPGITVPPLPPPLQNPPADNKQLYMAEDEMASWLHYPIEHFYSELLLQNPTPSTTASPPPTSVRPSSQLPARLSVTRGFPLFSMMVGSHNAPEPLPRSLSTVVGSNDSVGPSVVAPAVVVASTSPLEIPVSEGANTEGAMVSTSSSSTSTTAAATVTEEADVRTTTTDMGDRKRKRIEFEESFVSATTTTTTTTADAPNEEVELESGDEKKHWPGSSSTKRTRAAEVHNLSERRRRDRINEKMKALRDLIPRCNKSDKASMLDEAIEYLKTLQTQVQMMSMGCGMMPMMYQGMQQQYMPPMGMGVGMGTDMGMTRPVVSYAPAIPTATTSVMPPVAPRLSIPPYAMPSVQPPSVPTPNILVNPPNNLADSPYAHPGPGIPQIPNMVDPFQQYLAYQQMQMQMQMQMQIQMQASQSQTLSQPSSSKPGPSKSDDENEDDI